MATASHSPPNPTLHARLLAVAAAVGVAAISLTGAPARAQSFVNWESPHVHPMDMTPDGARLLAVNTADNRLEIFDISTGAPVKSASIPVGLDPVSVRARSNTEAWVVNHISDSVSVVSLSALNVIATLPAGDEPSDVVFAQGKAFVSVTQFNQIYVFNPADLSLAPTVLVTEGEAPRALATDGTNVYAAIFESGNKTTILSQQTVSSAANPYPGLPNPPPNNGAGFNPPVNGANPAAPAVSLIVKKMPDGTWRDDNVLNGGGGDWSSALSWDLHDHDVAIIDASTLSMTYVTGLMNANMAIATGPGTQVSVVGTDGINHIRFEPVVNGVFLRVMLARFDPASPATTVLTDLNPHLDYLTNNVPLATRNLSIGDPRAIVWNAAGTVGYVAGMGSNNVLLINASGARIGLIANPSDSSSEIGDGPTGIALDEARSRAYVMCKFGSAIAVVDTVAQTQVGYVGFFDPTPANIATGRHYLYNTHLTSGLGHVACASCHIDGRMDQLAWDLGNPAGSMQTFVGNCSFGAGGCGNWHPMKGPMATQTLIQIIGTEPLHWRGDRTDLAAFNGAFAGVQGRDGPLEPGQMGAMTDLVASFTNPPNPYRNFDNSLKTSLQIPGGANTGSPLQGLALFQINLFDGGVLTCVVCHALPSGTVPQVMNAGTIMETQALKIPQLRNMYFKTGFDKASSSANRGFGYAHDGADGTLVEFLARPEFRFSSNPAVAFQQRRDLEAFMFSFASDTHAAVGVQTTVADGGAVPPAQQTLITNMISLAQANAAGLVVKGKVKGKQRGYMYVSATSNFQGDRNSDAPVSVATLLSLAHPGSELTYTVVPFGSQLRIGVDRDGDGFYDRTELDVCADPANPNSFPGSPGSADRNADGHITPADVGLFINDWFNDLANGTTIADFDGDGFVTPADVGVFVNAWFSVLTNPC